MTPEVQMLAAAALWTMFLTLPIVVGRMATPGAVAWGMGNRAEDPPDVPAWCARAEKAHANMLENLPVFTAVVLAVHMAGRSGDASALGAQAFVAFRVAHGTSYVLGIPVVRTLFHFGGLGAILWMGSALL